VRLAVVDPLVEILLDMGRGVSHAEKTRVLEFRTRRAKDIQTKVVVPTFHGLGCRKIEKKGISLNLRVEFYYLRIHAHANEFLVRLQRK
jgi:hypothetical protein